MTRCRNRTSRAKKRQPPNKRNQLRLPPASADRQMEDFLGCCEYSVEQFEANRNKNLLRYGFDKKGGSSSIAKWYLESQHKEFEHQRAQYTSHCRCYREKPECQYIKDENVLGSRSNGDMNPKCYPKVNGSKNDFQNTDEKDLGLNGDVSTKCYPEVNEDLKPTDGKDPEVNTTENHNGEALALVKLNIGDVNQVGLHMPDMNVEETVKYLVHQTVLFEDDEYQAVHDTLEYAVSQVVSLENQPM